MKPIVTMRQALADQDLLEGVLGATSRLAWRAILIAAMGELLTHDEREVFQQLTQRASEPLTPIEELFIIAGRRGGKSSAIAALGIYISCLCDHSASLSIGERGVCLILATNTKQASVIFNYIVGALRSTPTLAALILNETSEVISLSNGIDIEVRAAGFRGLRGITAVAVICDETAFWFSVDDASRNTDKDILDAVRPALATTRGPLICVGSPYKRVGAMWGAFKLHFGAKGDPRLLVVKGTSRELNPTLPQSIVDRALERDEASARSEYLAEWRTDVDSYIGSDAVESVTILGRRELPPISDTTYFAFTDGAGGISGGDSMTVAISHSEGETVIVDALRERKPPFSPSDVVSEFSDLLKRYRVSIVTSDRWSPGFFREAWEARGISHRVSEKTKSQLYLELLPLISSQRVELLDVPRLAGQLTNLERRTARGGRDNVDHPPGGRDDLANSVAGAIALAAKLLPSGGFDINLFIRAYS